MAIIEVQPKDPVTLRVDVIDMGLLHLSETDPKSDHTLSMILSMSSW